MDEEALGTLWRWVDPRLARSGDGGVVISALLAGLLADLVRTLPRLPAPLQASVVSEVCSRPPRTTRGWAAWNAAHHAADDARRRVCPAG